MNWTDITSAVEHAQTLDEDAFTAFLNALPDDQETAQILRFLGNKAPNQSFMATASSSPFDEHQAIAFPDIVGPWKVDSLIASGGMADVFLAHRADDLYEQKVAIKVIKQTSNMHVNLFEIERQRLAKLTHPFIARIIDGGTLDDSRPFMIIEYIDGDIITDFVKQHKLDVNTILRLFIKVCGALSYAHNKLILHRDIKSSNVLISKDGQPKLIDFGIASDLTDHAHRCSALTLTTAAPEQLNGEAVSVQTDVFSLGVLLHELLLDQRPLRQADGGMQVNSEKISHSDLRAILCKALHKDPNQRYPSVTVLAEDLLAFLQHYPVTARQNNTAYKMMRFIQRNSLSTALGSLAIISLVTGLFVSIKLADDANVQAKRAELALQKSQWQFQRNEATLAAQQAYSDLLQRAFGGDKETARLTQLLLKRWQEAFADRSQDPNTAAALSYAIGRNFYFRGDNVSALKIFDTWMAEDIGSDALRAIGEEVYALMLYDSSRMDESINILRKLVSSFGDGSLTSEGDASNYAYRLARATKDPKDIAWSVQLLERRLASLESPFEQLFSYSQLAGLKALLNDFEGAYQAYSETLRIMEANPSYAVYGRDIARFNLASITLAWQGDHDKASTLVNKILNEDVPLKGESLQLARALMLKALLASAAQNFQDATSLIDQSQALFERFAGMNSHLHILSRTIKAFLLSNEGKQVDALALLQEIRQETELKEGILRNVTLIDLYIHAQTRSLTSEERNWLENTQVHADVKSNLVLLYIFKQLVDSGYAPAFWENTKP